MHVSLRWHQTQSSLFLVTNVCFIELDFKEMYLNEEIKVKIIKWLSNNSSLIENKLRGIFEMNTNSLPY